MELTHGQKSYRNNREKKKKQQYEYYTKLRADVLLALGGSCVVCGVSDPRVLQIDHVNGGGSKQRKSVRGLSFYRFVLTELEKGSKDFQLLCANCNWIKRYENKEMEFSKWNK